MSSLVSTYYRVTGIFSRFNYVPGLSLIQILSLLPLYGAGMGMAVYRLAFVGVPITVHIYGAIAVTVVSLLLLAAALRTEHNGVRMMGLFNFFFVFLAGFEGLFYFGGNPDPMYAIGMGFGFMGTLFTATGLLFFCIKHGD